MGAYGTYHTKTCIYCDVKHDELMKHGKHECDVQVLKDKIDTMGDLIRQQTEASDVLIEGSETMLKQMKDIEALVKQIVPNYHPGSFKMPDMPDMPKKPKIPKKPKKPDMPYTA
jgi:hypothetical protein